MHDDRTPDLFAWADRAKRDADVFAFPQSGNVGRARHVAMTFSAQPNEKRRESCWRRSFTTLWKQFARSGFDEAEVRHQVDGFRRAVELEFARMATNRNCGGAA